jgi:hypothetical protein
MNARFHGGPLDGQTHPADDWDEQGTPYTLVRAPEGEIDNVHRWHTNEAPAPLKDGTYYVLDETRGTPITMAHYLHVPAEGGD